MTGGSAKAPRGRLPGEVDPESLKSGYEVRDARFGSMLAVIIALAAGILLVIAVATVFETALTGRQGLFPFQTTIMNPPKATPPPAPQLETANGQVLDTLRADEDKLLHDYTWTDQKAGTLRIPIDRAIDLTTQRGLPTRPQNGTAAGGSFLAQPSGASSGRLPERTTP